MQLDSLNIKEQVLPFVLCGKFSLSEDAEEEDLFFLSDSQRDFTAMESLTLISTQAIEDDHLPFASKQETSYALSSSLYAKEL